VAAVTIKGPVVTVGAANFCEDVSANGSINAVIISTLKAHSDSGLP